MNIETHRITVSGITVEVVRKAIKNLHLGVYPPHGRVRVAAPLAVSDDAVKLAVISRLGWIKRQKAKFDAQSRQSRREMINGESHYFLGQRYRLNVIQYKGAGKVVLRNKSEIDIYVRPEADAEQRERVLQRWYRKQLKVLVPPLLEKWQQTLGVQVADWGIKKMKTKWGGATSKRDGYGSIWNWLRSPFNAWSTSSFMSWCICWNATTMIALPPIWTSLCRNGVFCVTR